MEEYTSKLYSFSAAYFLAHLFNILRTSGAIYGVSGIFTPPGILIFQKQVTLVTKFGDILLHFTCKIVTKIRWADSRHQGLDADAATVPGFINGYYFHNKILVMKTHSGYGAKSFILYLNL